MKTIIIGGVAGGATAAARLRRNNEAAQIILVERGPYISFANCGLPYHISGTIENRETLLVTSQAAFTARYNVDVRNRTEALSIDRKTKTIHLKNLITTEVYEESYDTLLLSPGAEPVRPNLNGIKSKRIFTLRSIPDLDQIMAHLQNVKHRRAVVIGGGYIGIEMAENLQGRGIFTTVIEGAPQILSPFDEEMAAIAHAHLRDKNIELYLGDRIEHFEDEDDHTRVFLASGKSLQADIVILAIGVRPETTLAQQCGLALGQTGGIQVNAYLQSSDPSIYAIGDAVEVRQIISGRNALIPLAGPANRQGRLAADNICAKNDTERKTYKGTLGTAILKVFDLTAACTGLNEKQLKTLHLPYHATITHSNAHATYFPGSRQISLKLLFSSDGTIYGAQAIGVDGVDKRIDVIATAIQSGLRVNDLAELELAYAPPYSSAKDPVNIAGYVASNVRNGTHEIIGWRELQEKIQTAPSEFQLIDVRTAEEFAIGSLPTARNIPLDTIRNRLSELDKDKNSIVFCQVGMRGYLAYRILKQSGFHHVRNLTGGLKTYMWATQKQDNPDIFVSEDDRLNGLLKKDPALPTKNNPPASVHHKLDAAGLQCPGPIIKTYQAVSALQPGEEIEITASDPAFGQDIRAWALKTGNEIVSINARDGLIIAALRKGKKTPETSAPGTSLGGFTEVIFSGDIDKVMASLIIANGAMAMGKKVSLFFTFWGLSALRKTDSTSFKKTLTEKIFGVMLPKGTTKLNSLSNMNYFGIGAILIKRIMATKHIATPAELLHTLVAGGANITACQMSMDMMGIRREELIDGVDTGGVATFLAHAEDAGTTLFI